VPQHNLNNIKMRVTSLLVAAAVGVTAHPSVHPHRHFHRSDSAAHTHAHVSLEDLKLPLKQSPRSEAHITAEDLVAASNAYVQKRDGETVSVTINGKLVSYKKGESPFMKYSKPKSAPPPAPAPTTATPPPPPPPATTSATPAAPVNTKDNGLGPASYEPFCGGAKSKRVELFDVFYKGNTGAGKYGCNIKLIQASAKDSYKYTSRFLGGGSDCKCKIWMKIGPDGGVNGFFNGNEVTSFDLKAGKEQWVAYEENTQGGACCSCSGGGIPLTPLGQFKCPWAEFDYGNAKNAFHFGADASTIVNGVYGGPFFGLKITNPKTSVVSKVFQGGGGENAFLPGDEYKDGLGHNDVPGPVTYDFDFGFTH
jgi:hypothetical protein